MSPDDPRHGTNAGANQHMRDGEKPCRACRDGKSRYDKGALYDRDRGRPREVRLGAAAYAVAQRCTTGYLAHISGVNRQTISEVRGGSPDAMVFRSTRDALLAAAPQATWTGIGIIRRTRALAALGWSARAIAKAGNASEASILRLFGDANPSRVRADVALKIVAAYDELSTRRPPADDMFQQATLTKARKRAREQGFQPPAAWDDIDDPSGQPAVPVAARDELDPVVVQRIIGGDWRLPANRAERTEAVRQWVAQGVSLAEIERRTGWHTTRYQAAS